MTLSLSPELEERVESEIAMGDFQTSDQLIEEAVQFFLEKRRSMRRRQAQRELGDAVEAAGLYDQVYIPSDED